MLIIYCYWREWAEINKRRVIVMTNIAKPENTDQKFLSIGKIEQFMHFYQE